MALLETGDGRKLPNILLRLSRLHRRLVLVRELLRALDTERDEHLPAMSGDAITTKRANAAAAKLVSTPESGR